LARPAIADLGTIDAHSFHYLETWALSSSEPYTTEYLSDVYYFQRQATTWAFKFASGAAEGAVVVFLFLSHREAPHSQRIREQDF
jgi:hypothetical protein